MENVDYTDTFITVSPDSSRTSGVEPPGETVAAATYRMIAAKPYQWTSSEVIFSVWADRHGLPSDQRDAAWVDFYAKPRACLRSSDLGKKWGWGIHADHEGRLMVYPVGSEVYHTCVSGTGPDGRALTVRPAMRTKR